MSWKFSVSEYLPPLDRPTTKETVLYTTANAGATSIDIAGTLLSGSNGTESYYYLHTGDIIKLGPSTATANKGATEVVRVKTRSRSSGKTTVTLNSAITYAYATGDPVVYASTCIPEGWVYKASSSGSGVGGGVLDFHPANALVDGVGIVDTGFRSQTGFNIGLTTGTGAHYVDHFINRKLIRGATYRLGCYIYSSGSNGVASAILVLYNDTTAITTVSVDIKNALFTWSKVENTGTWPTSTNGMRTDSRVYLGWSGAHATGWTQIDCIYLTHAQLTDGYASGVYTCPTNPVEVDAQTNGRVNVITDFDSYRSVVTSNISSEPMRAYRIIWDDADETFLRNLEILSWWQDRGYDLMLEGDFSPNTRPLFGKMKYGLSYPHWDTSRVTVTMDFEGR